MEAPKHALDGYIFGELIGKGAYGDVFKVTRTVDNAAFACKVVDLAGVPSAESVEILREIETMRSLHHVGIVGFVCAHTDDVASKLFIVMELCTGGDLVHYLAKLPGKRLQLGDFKRLIVSLLQPLRYLHLEGFLHRDIKPDNIFVARDGSIKYGDLGVSKMMHGTLSYRGTCMGTPVFMAPEVLVLEDEDPDVRHAGYGLKADIWSLGVTL